MQMKHRTPYNLITHHRFLDQDKIPSWCASLRGGKGYRRPSSVQMHPQTHTAIKSVYCLMDYWLRVLALPQRTRVYETREID